MWKRWVLESIILKKFDECYYLASTSNTFTKKRILANINSKRRKIAKIFGKNTPRICCKKFDECYYFFLTKVWHFFSSISPRSKLWKFTHKTLACLLSPPPFKRENKLLASIREEFGEVVGNWRWIKRIAKEISRSRGWTRCRNIWVHESYGHHWSVLGTEISSIVSNDWQLLMSVGSSDLGYSFLVLFYNSLFPWLEDKAIPWSSSWYVTNFYEWINLLASLLVWMWIKFISAWILL